MTKQLEPVAVSGQGLSPDETALLRALCQDQGWHFSAAGQGGGGDLTVLSVSEGLAALETRVRQGGAVVALLESQGAAQVAPSLRAGAVDCLVRPLEPGKTLAVLRRCLELGSLAREVKEQEEQLWRGLPATRLVGESPALAVAVAQAVQAAEFPVDVLIRGETGTGKELLARVVHERSARRLAPFVAVDCGAINPDLADSVLFGHRRGAFTGAVEDHVGLLEQADGGTLFLDEIGNLSPAIQAKLLRALQNREIWRLGDTVAQPVDFRVLAATHVDLEREAEEGRFRSDLYHRLADLKILLPPLRERGDDVGLLAKLFLSRHRARFDLGPCTLSVEALECLRRFDWPGNVRQLDNALRRAALLAGDEVLPEQLPPEILVGPSPGRAVAMPRAQDQDLPLPEGLLPLWDLEQIVTRQVELQAIQAALREAGQDRDKAAAILDLHPKTLARKMRTYAL